MEFLLLSRKLKNQVIGFSKRPFVRNVAMVATGTVAAQSISFIFYPIITRLYGPEAFGVFGVYASLTAMLTPIAALSYPVAIVLPKQDNEARGLVYLSLLTVLFTSGLVFTAIFFFKGHLVDILDVEPIADYLFLIPLLMIFAVLLTTSGFWLIRKKLFKLSAKIDVVQSLLLNSTKAGIGFFNPSAVVLILITTFGVLIHAIMIFFGLKGVKKNGLTDYSWKYKRDASQFLNLAGKYKDFPLLRSPQILIDAVSNGLPVLMLTSFFGPLYAGLYTLGKSVLQVPSQLFGQAIGNVFYPRIAEALHSNEVLKDLIVKATVIMAAASFLPFAIIAAFGPFLFGYVFGQEWIAAGEYSRWLALWLYFILINKPSVAAIPVLKMQGFYLIYEIFNVIVKVSALGLGFYYFKNDLYAIIFFSLVGVVMNTGLITAVYVKAMRYQKDKVNNS